MSSTAPWSLLVNELQLPFNSVLLTTAVACYYLLWRHRSVLRVVMGVAVNLAFVLLGNVVRITLGAWLSLPVRYRILPGWPHELLE